MAVTYENTGEGGRRKRGTRPEDYSPSDQVQSSQAALENTAAQRPEAYTSPYAGAMNDLIQEIGNRPQFRYDPENDPLYRRYRDQYRREGRLAMENTMGQAAGLTGGYSSSYSQGAGQAAYYSYLDKLNDLIPQLYEQALDLYDREGDALLDRFDLLSGLEDREYGRYSDSYDRWLQEFGLAQDRYDRDLEMDYSQFTAMLGYWADQEAREQAQANWQAEMDLDREKFQWQQSQANAKGAARSTGGTGPSKTQKTEDTDPKQDNEGGTPASTVHTNGMTQRDVEGWAREYMASGNGAAIGSADMQNWMRQHGIYGSAAQAFTAALQSLGYAPGKGGR